MCADTIKETATAGYDLKTTGIYTIIKIWKLIVQVFADQTKEACVAVDYHKDGQVQPWVNTQSEQSRNIPTNSVPLFLF